MDDPGDRYPAEPRNSPLALLGVIGALLLVLLLIAVPSQGTRTVDGIPMAAPGPVKDAKPNAAAPPQSSGAPVAKAALENNALLTPGMSLPPTTCKLPTFGKSPDQLKAYYQAMVDCLDNAWKPLLAQAGEPFEPPTLSVDDNPTSSCGTPSSQIAVAFYCPRDETIFMPRGRVLDSMGTNQGSHIMVLAHEYGHHVQLLSGINQGLGQKMHGLTEGTPPYLELTRRMELQADCFSGMFITSVTGRGTISKTLGTAAGSSFRSSVTDDTHGTVKHQIQWGTTGVKNNSTSACNTWLAPASDIS